MFNFFKKAYQKIFNACSQKLHTIFSQHEVDEDTLEELEKTLLEADTGITTTRSIMSTVRNKAQKQSLSGTELKSILHNNLTSILTQRRYTENGSVYMLVGVNGSGKTSCAGKLATYFKNQGKRVLLAGADTFRAAAIEQLHHYAQEHAIAFEGGKQGQDPASIVYPACKRYIDENFDILIIDTAGRLQTKQNLMQEITKMSRVAQKHISQENITTLLTLDALLGQNSYDQATLFHEATHVDGVVLTKMDATAKGGIVFSVMQNLSLPIAYTTYGENITNIAPFSPEQYVDDLLA